MNLRSNVREMKLTQNQCETVFGKTWQRETHKINNNKCLTLYFIEIN